MANPGCEFEKAVHDFVKILDPKAQVIFDHKVADRDTGATRQCDVWINAKYGGHWPLSILISCKDRAKSGRKLDAGHIGTFCDEVRSTGATTGVIYCNTGFTKQAIKKAEANEISCCRLYKDESPDIPEAIWLEQFLCEASIQIAVNKNFSAQDVKTWNDIFNIELKDNGQITTVLDVIAESFHSDEKKVIAKVPRSSPFPSNWQTNLHINSDKTKGVFRIKGLWKKYRARIEAMLLDGSYIVSNSSFLGTQKGPVIALRESHPGNGWIRMTDDEKIPSSNRIIAVLSGGDIKTALRENMGMDSIELYK